MEFPFFALQKRPLLTPIIYQDGNVSIRISPGERGIATIWDKDVLIYLSSLINAKIERGEEVSRTVRIAAYDMLRVTRRHTGKNGYQEIYDALFRLRSTTITTDIQSGGERETRGFGWIDSFRILTKESKIARRAASPSPTHMENSCGAPAASRVAPDAPATARASVVLQHPAKPRANLTASRFPAKAVTG